MKKRTKTLGLVLAAVLLVAASIFGTLAYLTDKTVEVKNTLTFGNVQITLDEALLDDEGNPVFDDEQYIERTIGPQNYKAYPGAKYLKDPTVTNVGSEDAWVRVFLTYNKAKLMNDYFPGAGLGSFLLPIDTVLWKVDWEELFEYDSNKDVYEFEFRYKHVLQAGMDAQLFHTLKIPVELTSEQSEALETMEITVRAEAVQTDGFADYEEAWAAIDAQAP